MFQCHLQSLFLLLEWDSSERHTHRTNLQEFLWEITDQQVILFHVLKQKFDLCDSIVIIIIITLLPLLLIIWVYIYGEFMLCVTCKDVRCKWLVFTSTFILIVVNNCETPPNSMTIRKRRSRLTFSGLHNIHDYYIINHESRTACGKELRYNQKIPLRLTWAIQWDPWRSISINVYTGSGSTCLQSQQLTFRGRGSRVQGQLWLHSYIGTTTGSIRQPQNTTK